MDPDDCSQLSQSSRMHLLKLQAQRQMETKKALIREKIAIFSAKIDTQKKIKEEREKTLQSLQKQISDKKNILREVRRKEMISDYLNELLKKKFILHAQAKKEKIRKFLEWKKSIEPLFQRAIKLSNVVDEGSDGTTPLKWLGKQNEEKRNMLITSLDEMEKEFLLYLQAPDDHFYNEARQKIISNLENEVKDMLLAVKAPNDPLYEEIEFKKMQIDYYKQQGGTINLDDDCAMASDIFVSENDAIVTQDDRQNDRYTLSKDMLENKAFNFQDHRDSTFYENNDAERQNNCQDEFTVNNLTTQFLQPHPSVVSCAGHTDNEIIEEIADKHYNSKVKFSKQGNSSVSEETDLAKEIETDPAKEIETDPAKEIETDPAKAIKVSFNEDPLFMSMLNEIDSAVDEEIFQKFLNDSSKMASKHAFEEDLSKISDERPEIERENAHPEFQPNVEIEGLFPEFCADVDSPTETEKKSSSSEFPLPSPMPILAHQSPDTVEPENSPKISAINKPKPTFDFLTAMKPLDDIDDSPPNFQLISRQMFKKPDANVDAKQSEDKKNTGFQSVSDVMKIGLSKGISVNKEQKQEKQKSEAQVQESNRPVTTKTSESSFSFPKRDLFSSFTLGSLKESQESNETFEKMLWSRKKK